MQNKKRIYILSFTVLGVLLGFLAEALVEIFYIKLLVKDFVAYSFGLSWSELIQLRFVFIVVVVLFSALWGFASGKYWWRQIYVLKKYRQKYK